MRCNGTHRHMITFSCAVHHAAAFTLPSSSAAAAAAAATTSRLGFPLSSSTRSCASATTLVFSSTVHVSPSSSPATATKASNNNKSSYSTASSFTPGLTLTATTSRGSLSRQPATTYCGPRGSPPGFGRGFFNKGAPHMNANSKVQSGSPPNNGNGNNFINGSNNMDLDRGLFASSPELEQLAMKSTDAPILTRIVSYNVLSSSLAGASHFPDCKPSNLDGVTRLKRVLTKLEGPVAARSIICLQEVSLAWSGHLHSFFANRGFHLVLASHGSYFNGYMGEALAFPLDLYEAVDVHVERLSDTMKWPMADHASLARKQQPLPFLARLQKAWKVLFPPAPSQQQQSSYSPKPKREPWDHARARYNRFIFARLRSRTNGAKFCVATYHMPCIFWSPPVMLIHAGLVVRQFQRLCGSDMGVLAGDFNIKPDDSVYNMIVTGSIDPGHADFPPTCPDGSSAVSWFPMPMGPMKSAYKEVLGHEPDFTNYARVEDQPTFIETLDYVFCTPDVDVVDVVRLPHRDAVVGPFPDAVEPSDHILIGATLRLPAPVRRQFQGSTDYNMSTGLP